MDRRLMFAKDFTVDYLRFTALESGTFTFTIGSEITVSDISYIEYSIDEGETWVNTDNVASTTVTITTPTISTGDSVLWRGSGNKIAYTGGYSSASRNSIFSSTCTCSVSGVLNTLLGLNKPNSKATNQYMYYSLFKNMTTLVDASGLIFPDTTNTNCFGYMFYGCSSLLTPPAILPATTLSNSCYSNMFATCTLLASAPQLPATTLASSCYSSMFYSCRALKTAPFIPAKTAIGCSYMFQACTALNYVNAAFINLGTNETSNWLYNVSSTGTFVKHPLATWDEIGVNGVPSGWVIQYNTSLITEYNPQNSFTPAGYLTFSHSSTIYVGLVSKCTFQTIYVSKDGTNWHELKNDDCIAFSSSENCYVCGMLTSNASPTDYTQLAVGGGDFSISGNCNSIWNYTDLSASLKNYCGYNLFMGCSTLVSTLGFSLPSSTLSEYCYYGMFYGCSSLSDAPQLPAMTATGSCYRNMFYGCSSLSDAPQLPATTLSSYCYHSMFFNCTSLTSAPELLARTLPTYCYTQMFYGCSSLNYVKALFVNNSTATTYTSNWLYGVSSTGTFIKHPLSSWSLTGASGVPDGWTIQYDTSVITTFNPQENFTPAGYITFSHTTTFYLSLYRICSYQTVYVSKNGTNWHSLQTTDCLEFGQNDNCYVCGTLTSSSSSSNYTQFLMNGDISISGNINSMWDYSNLNAALRTYCGYGLFYGCKNIISIENLTFPSTTLQNYCYTQMFYECSNITTAPVLPAISFAYACYNSMFRYCSNLNYVKALFTSTPSSSYTSYWLASTSSTGIFVKNFNATWTTTGNHGIPTAWTVLYFDPDTEKYYLNDKTTECDDHGNVITN